MLPTTMQAVRSILAADPSINTPERNRLLWVLRHGPEAKVTHSCTAAGPRIMRRKEVAQRLSVSLRTVDKLAKMGALRKRRLPGRVRASGFLESDVVTLLTGGSSNDA